MGLKGLGRENFIDSLGVIMFDATCNIDDPDGARLEVPTFEPKKEPEPEPEQPEKTIEIVFVAPEQEVVEED